MSDTHASEQSARAHTFAHLLLDTAKTLSRGNRRYIQRFHRDHGFTHMQRHLDYLLGALRLSADVHQSAQSRDTEASRVLECAEVLVAVTRFLGRTAAQADGIGPQLLHVELMALQLYLLRLLRETGGFDDLLERYDIEHEECLAELRERAGAVESAMTAVNGHKTSDREEVEALKAAVDLVTFIESHGVPLQKTGVNWRGHCPFHPGDDTPSLSVNPREQLWRCFGCNKAGDIFSFLQLKEGMSFPQALKYLRGQNDLPVAMAPPKTRRSVSAPTGEALPGGYTRPQLLTRVAEFYRNSLAESKAAQSYLRSRGLDSPELAESFRLGFSDGDSLLKTLPESGDLRDAMVALGVVTAKGRELFAGCVVIPLDHPDDGGVVGLYGRRINPKSEFPHMYLPGPQRGVLNWQALNGSRTVFVAESLLDALSLWAAGVRDVTACFGSKGLHADLTELLARFAIEEVRLCFDADVAGREGTLRVAQQLTRRGVRCVQVMLPDESDPNAILTKHGGATLRAYTEQLHPVELDDGTEVAPDVAPVEETANGFVIRFGDIEYGVTPLPPFSGRLIAIVRPKRGDREWSDKGDLVKDRVRRNMASQAIRQFELDREEAEQHMMAILRQAERWVEVQQQAKTSQAAVVVVPMASDEQEQALNDLRRPDLVTMILEDLSALGYAGEDNAKLLAYLVGLSRKLEAPMAATIRSQSSAGKSALAELIESTVPPEEVVALARLSQQALFWEKRDYLKRKLVIIEERAGGEQADYSIRVLLSKRRLEQAVVIKDPSTGQMATQHFVVEGPISYIETTTSATINYENRTRCFEIYLDEGEDQTRRIHDKQREARMEGSKKRQSADAVCRRHHNMQRLLESCTVYLPYARLMTFPTRWLRTRRDHQRFLCLIEAVAFLHQHQREGGFEEVDGQPARFIRATLDDYRTAYRLARDILRITLHELSRDGSELLARSRAMVEERSKRSEPAYFTRKELRAFTDWQDHRLREALAELVEMEYVERLGGSQGKTYHYRLNTQSGGEAESLHELTTPEQLEARMREAGMLP